MAETRSQQTLKDAVVKETTEAIGSQLEKMEETIAEQNNKIDKNVAIMFEAIKFITEKTEKAISSIERFQQPSTHEINNPVIDQPRSSRSGTNQTYNGMTRLGRLDFPRFGGDKIREWLFKVEEFFTIDNTPEELKVRLSSIHFDGSASTWHQAVMQSENGSDLLTEWNTYKGLLIERFEEVLDDPIAELKRLQETDGIVEYNEKFELIRSRVKLSEQYLMSAYLAGLRNETQMHVRMFQPQTVRQCFVLGRLYEMAHPTKQSVWSGSKQSFSKNSFQHKKEGEQKAVVAVSSEQQKNPILQPRKFLTPAEMSDRRAKGLCYFCDEKFTPAHYLTHKKAQLYLMDVNEEEELEDGEVRAILEQQNEEGEIAHISVNAIAGVSDYTTMKVKGIYAKKPLFVLIDSGSTHNFMDTKVANRLGCKVIPPGLAKVTVADGGQLRVTGKVEKLRWNSQGHSFQADFMVIDLGNCDMVLGVQWLKTLGPITWDFDRLVMQFKYESKKVTLNGIHPGSVREAKAAKINKISDSQPQLSMIYAYEAIPEGHMELCAIEGGDNTKIPPAIQQLLTEFADIFVEPTKLPPFRENHNHKIPLLEGANPVNQRPYRYALYQKNEIDKMVQDMMKSGTIQPSSSPYASPVVLVKKKDGSWRLCVDYRGLNELTIKDRFPIPLIEDLMDELGGSVIYSKIDLRAGYHQVRMDVDDIHKTAFKTHSGHYEYLVMPFGLTNAPATFQSLMNSVFREFLRKSVLIFFDDILVYSKSLEEHEQHLREVFEVMRSNSLFAKESKCEFATERVEYLGHYIEKRGISTDPNKVKAVAEWPQPKSVKQLRGFLGLAGYYRRFVKDFGTIARPLTTLTKKEGFSWCPEADDSFGGLKNALCKAPVLALPRFDKPFVVETDASGSGIGAVLMQEGHPVAYISRHLKGKQLHLSIYEKELLAVVFAVQKWRHYLLHRHFVIKTDQKSLKYLLEQRLNTPIQQQWLPKLLEFDYEIQYRQGKDNVAADALSRVEGAEVLHMSMSVSDCDLMKEIKEGYNQDDEMKQIIEKLKKEPGGKKHYSWVQNILRRKSKIAVPANRELRNKILDWLHSSGVGGHSGRDATMQRVKGLFYWKGLSKDIHAFIRQCGVCQTCKYDNAASPGLIQPLPIPESIWTDISMDFIDGLPLSFGKSVIFVVVDRLSKAAHFMTLAHPYTALTVAQAFLDTVFRLHGLPRTIVSDRDAVFLSDFWRELFALQGVGLNFSSAYHPQSDGQTEVVNRCLETYLRCMCSDRPYLWSKWIPLAEYWYNTSFHTATHITPFEAVYGQPPPIHLPYLPGESKVAVVARTLQERENMILILKFHLLRAQHRMQQNADLHRTDRSFEIGDYVFVKLQPYRQKSLVIRGNQKLAPKYFGPYKIIDTCGKVAYKLELPQSSSIHPVFHVSQLKELVGNIQVATQLPAASSDVLLKEPELIVERKMVQRQGRAATMVLVKWSNEPVEEATWELLFDLQKKFPHFKP